MLQSDRAGDRPGRVVESIPPFRFRLDLSAGPGGFEMRLAGWSLGPCPLPRALAPHILARAETDGAAYRFLVDIALPGLGRLIRYEGELATP